VEKRTSEAHPEIFDESNPLIYVQNSIAQLKIMALISKSRTGKDTSRFLRDRFIVSLAELFAEHEAERPKAFDESLSKMQRRQIEAYAMWYAKEKEQKAKKRPSKAPNTLLGYVRLGLLPVETLNTWDPDMVQELVRVMMKDYIDTAKKEQEEREKMKKYLYLFYHACKPWEVFNKIFQIQKGRLPL
jgi:hypothetical protein